MRKPETTPAPLSLDRRTFVVSAAFAFVALVTAKAEAAPLDAEGFRKLSQFLTGAADLDATLAGRVLGQLSALDAKFPDEAAALAEAVAGAGAQSMDGFLAQPASSDAGLRGAMATVVGAWYLGYTGTPISLRAEDDTGFVTFTEALMYPPTIDATVRPTYARAGLNYWVDPPPFVTPPPMPAAMKAWGRESPQGVGAIPVTPAPAGEAPIALPPPASP